MQWTVHEEGPGWTHKLWNFQQLNELKPKTWMSLPKKGGETHENPGTKSYV